MFPINNAPHISNRNLDKLSYRFSIMHKIELPDAPIGGFFFKKNMEVTKTLFMSMFKETRWQQYVTTLIFLNTSKHLHAQNLLKIDL